MTHTILAFSFLVLLPILAAADPKKIGVCHGRVGDNLPSSATVVDLLYLNNISKARLFLPDPAVLPAFNATGVKLMVGVPNENLTFISTGGRDAALSWIKSNILAFLSPDQVNYLAVGNEVLYKDQFYSPHLMPAINNLYEALQFLGLDQKIKLSSPHASSILAASYPPSAGAFDPSTLSVLKPMLEFLAQTNAPFMVNTYPFISYVNDPTNIALNYAMFGSDATPVIDGDLTYTNLFDATVDSIVAAMEREGFAGVPVAVTETGWPTSGHEVATPENAAVYNGKIVERVAGGIGTPRRPGTPVEVYLFDLYDENGKSGEEFEKHFGIFKLDGTKAYNINFT
ncbi:glucan endo-1,3-beta-glucosidase-like [Typha angustifolia]|uniref:glucan endo-1,3-beta-glucosidase-like n=1 Tax=Typha angustifolia TaxID=59011 RepID=UPI003C2D008F